MKRIFVILVLLLFSCNSENAADCFKTDGSLQSIEVPVDQFNRILVNENVELIIKQGTEQKVVIESGANLIKDVTAEVTDGQLILTDHNSCNIFRDYNVTKVYVTSPDLAEIRSSTQYDVSSDGILNYPSLRLYSEDYNTDYQNTGDFDLTISATTLAVVFNNLSNARISGTVQNLNINYASGNGRFEGAQLQAVNVSIYHRGSNDIIVNPLASLKGNIYSTGDVIAVNHPPVVEVTEHYKGKLVFRN